MGVVTMECRALRVAGWLRDLAQLVAILRAKMVNFYDKNELG